MFPQIRPFLARLGLQSVNTKGTTAIEYAIIAAGIAAVVLGVVRLLGTNVLGTYQSVEGKF